MLAAERRLEVSAHNVANATTASFRALRADQTEQPDGGTAVKVSQTTEGVDLIGEAEQQMIARYTFAANGRVLGIQYRMQKSLIDMLA